MILNLLTLALFVICIVGAYVIGKGVGNIEGISEGVEIERRKQNIPKR